MTINASSASLDIIAKAKHYSYPLAESPNTSHSSINLFTSDTSVIPPYSSMFIECHVSKKQKLALRGNNNIISATQEQEEGHKIKVVKIEYILLLL